MGQHLTVQPVDDGTEEIFAVLLGFTPEWASTPGIEYLVTDTLGAFGMRPNGSTYWSDDLVPSSEQAFLTHEAGSYFLTRG